MSYNCSDFVQDCELNADLYKAPQVDFADLETCDPNVDGDGLRVLAERVARAMARVLAFHGIQCSAGSRLD
jgi:hypothetical protein